MADGDALAKLFDQIPSEEQIDVIGGDGAYDTKPCHAAIAARSAIPSIPPHEGAAHWPADMFGAAWRHGEVDAIARDSRREWKKDSGLPPAVACREYAVSVQDAQRQLSLGASHRLAGDLVRLRVGVINRMADFARPQSVRIA